MRARPSLWFALALALTLLAGRAWGDAYCGPGYYVSALKYGGLDSASASCSSVASNYGGSCTGSVASDAGTAGGQYSCTITCNGSSFTAGGGTISGVCSPNPQCGVTPGTQQDALTVLTGTHRSDGTVCYQGCAFSVAPSMIVTPSGVTSSLIAKATAVGNCTGSERTATPGQCVSAGGVSACTEKGAKAGNCGTVNGDEVCVDAVQPGQCQSFASGGAMCVTDSSHPITTPPAPNNGTPGSTTPATPTASFEGKVGSTVETANYYNSTVVTQSTKPVVTQPGGTNTGNGGTIATGGSSLSQPNAASGDCGASGVNCTSTGDATLPSLPTEPTVQSSIQAELNAIQASRLVSSVTGVQTALSAGGGSCTNPSYNLNIMGKAVSGTMDWCSTWDLAAPIIGIVMLAVWCLVGVRIIMSA